MAYKLLRIRLIDDYAYYLLTAKPDQEKVLKFTIKSKHTLITYSVTAETRDSMIDDLCIEHDWMSCHSMP